MLSIQVLVATMNQHDHSLLDKMNIQTDAIVGNQCDFNKVEDFVHDGHKIKYLNFSEIGVGLNRNNALMRANADICIFADDDMVFVDDYAGIVNHAFELCPKADVLIFNLIEEPVTRYVIPRIKRVNRFNYLRYGAARIAVKLQPIKINGIFFNQCFGGGTEHYAGEDNLFLTSCLDKKLKIYAVPFSIATLSNDRNSTWFEGYNEKYLSDLGLLYYCISKKNYIFLCLQDAIRRHNSYQMSWFKSFRIMMKSIRLVKNNGYERN